MMTNEELKKLTEEWLAAGNKPKFALPIPPTAETATQALLALFLIYKVLSPVSTYH